MQDDEMSLQELADENQKLFQQLSELSQENAALQRERDALVREVCRLWPSQPLRNFLLFLSHLPKGHHSAWFNWKGQRLVRQRGYFDYLAYLRDDPDLCRRKFDPLLHYIWYGWAEGRNPNDSFDSAAYLDAYPDVARSGNNPYVHYLIFGKRENRTAFLPAERSPRKPEAGPLVSIIMPTWNRKALIARAIDSVLMQSYPHYELLIVDDGSTDGTERMVRARYPQALQSGRIRYFVQEKGGVCAARNFGLAHASGELIAYLDSDNAWHADYLETMVAAFSQPAVSCAYADQYFIDHVTGSKRLMQRAYDRRALLDHNYIDLNIFMHRKALYERFGGFDTLLTRLVDWELILRYTACGEPTHVPAVLADYYVEKDANHISHTESYEKNRAIILQKFRSERAQYGLL